GLEELAVGREGIVPGDEEDDPCDEEREQQRSQRHGHGEPARLGEPPLEPHPHPQPLPSIGAATISLLSAIIPACRTPYSLGGWRWPGATSRPISSFAAAGCSASSRGNGSRPTWRSWTAPSPGSARTRAARRWMPRGATSCPGSSTRTFTSSRRSC